MFDHVFEQWHAPRMAGGMGRRTGPSLAERVLPPSDAPDPSIRHCWVADPEGALARHPGLLLEWRKRSNEQWMGLVAYVPSGQSPAVHLVQRWLPAAALTARP